ncbi:MAG: hypothetical protein IJ746_00435 [Ruminococcus sp.]|nr:hypothetical protein [Ruminococcus sp.]
MYCKNKQKTICFIVSIVLAFMCCICNNATPAHASMSDWYTETRYPSKNIPFRYYASYNDMYKTAIINSKNAWNHYTPVTFTINSNSDNYVAVYALSANSSYGYYYGRMYSDSVSDSSLNRFHIVLNSTAILKDANNPSRFIQSVFTHELGHVLGLKDNPPAPQRGSIMLYNITRDVLYLPQQYDINNVKTLYN